MRDKIQDKEMKTGANTGTKEEKGREDVIRGMSENEGMAGERWSRDKKREGESKKFRTNKRKNTEKKKKLRKRKGEKLK